MFMQKILFFTGFVNNNSSFPKPLKSHEEAEYIKKFHEGDMQAKEVLIHHNLRLVAHIVKKYSQTEEADDLISVGSLGLLKAINSYKEGLGTQFSTYAAKCIENEILMLLRVNKKHKNDCSVDDILSSDEENNSITVMDLAYEENSDVSKMTENIVLSEKLYKIIEKHLSRRERQILTMRYGLGNTPALTQREVAVKLGISRSYISRLEKKALKTLKSVMKRDDYL